MSEPSGCNAELRLGFSETGLPGSVPEQLIVMLMARLSASNPSTSDITSAVGPPAISGRY